MKNKIKENKSVSKFDEAKEDIALLLRARTPILYIISDEKERSLVEMFHKMCEEGTSEKSYKKELFCWDCSRGVTKQQIDEDGVSSSLSVEKDVLDPVSALDYFIGLKQSNNGSQLDHVYILSEFHHYLREPMVQRKLRIFSENNAQIEKKSLVMISTKNPGIQGKMIPQELENIIYLYDWPYPDSVYIRNYITNIIPSMNKRLVKASNKYKEMNFTDEEINDIVNSCKGMTAKQIEDAVRKCFVQEKTFKPATIALEKRQIIKKSGSCDIVEPSGDLSDIGGLDVLKDWLKHRKASLTDDAIEFGCDLPKGLLCVGPWGSGKTTVAKAIISEWQLPGLRIDVSKMFGMYVGESEGRTKEILNLADSIAPCILWWDEVENIFTNNGQSNSGTDGGTSSRVLGLISTWMSEHKGLVFNIFTANDISDSPPKLFRKGRLDEIFVVDLPVKEEREEILKIHVKKRLAKTDRIHLMDDIDFKVLSKYSQNFSGAELEGCVNTAMLTCYNEGKRELKTDDILDAIKHMIPMSSTMREPIEHIRNWQEGRAVRASKHTPEELLTKEEVMDMLRSAQHKGIEEDLEL